MRGVRGVQGLEGAVLLTCLTWQVQRSMCATSTTLVTSMFP